MTTAFVTGAGSGIGFAIAHRLLALGWNVVATDKETGPWSVALGAPRPQLRILSLDVRNSDQVHAAAQVAGDVDLLVNNAGIAIFGTQEESDLDAVRDLFEVNVLGPARVTQALLPSLRQRKGTIVQISSLAGKAVFPESGFYAATKHALEAMSEALVQEVAPFGVRVRVVEPGAYATRLQDTAAAASRNPPADSPYAELRPVWDARREETLTAGGAPDEVAQAVVASLEDPAPFARLAVGVDAAHILDLRNELGDAAFVQLSIERNGGPASDRGPAHVRSPQEVLSAPDHVLEPTRAAYVHGHLGHWAEGEDGQEALSRLEALSGSRGANT
ncbi:MAG: SDR family oxidoreductase [Myxococcota bacterium]